MALSRRFINDGTPEERLDPVQERAKEKLIADKASGRIVFEKNPCLCGEDSLNAYEVSAKDFHGFPLNVYLCRRCALIYCDPYMTIESAGTFYRDYYRDLYEGESVRTVAGRFAIQNSEGRDIFNFLKERIGMAGIKSVFEMGCAAGGLLEVFRDASFEVTGIDFDDRYLDFGRARGLRLINSSLEKYIETANEKYDLVIVCHVFEHMHDPTGVLGLIKKILSPRGVLFIEVPNIDLSYIELSQFQLAHKWYFDKVTLLDLLDRIGFEVVGVSTEPHLRVIGRVVNSSIAGTVILRTEYALKKYRRGKLFERLLPLLSVIRALRIGTLAKTIYYRLIGKDKLK